MKGIYTAKKANGDTYYRASITYRSKHIALGSSEDMEEAAALYTTGRRILDDTSYEIDSFDEFLDSGCVEAFEHAITELLQSYDGPY